LEIKALKAIPETHIPESGLVAVEEYALKPGHFRQHLEQNQQLMFIY
jgi:hypothetical protein